MIKEKLIKFSYKYLYFFVRFWYQLTVKISKPKKHVEIPKYSNYLDIIEALSWGSKWKSDPLNGLLDVMPHPKKVQLQINKNDNIDDCDGHAIYLGTALLNSNLASRVWIGTVHMKLKDGKTSGHCICIFKGIDDNSFYWWDYSMPKKFDSLQMFDWTHDVCVNFNAQPIAAGFFELNHLNNDLTPIFSKKTITKLF